MSVISIDKELAFSEPYELRIECYYTKDPSSSYNPEPVIKYQTTEKNLTHTAMADVLVGTFSSSSGKITFGATYSPQYWLHIKNLYFKRVRE